MLSFLTYRKEDHSDSEDEDDQIAPNKNGQPIVPVPRSGIPKRFAALSIDTIDSDTIDYASDMPVPKSISNDLRPDEEIGLTENGKKHRFKKTLGGGASDETGTKPKIVKVGTTAGDKQKAENIYAANKSVAESMMDIALLTSNANQLKFLLSYNTKSKTFYVNVTLIAFSLMLQVAVGVSLIVKKNLRGKRYSRTTHYINQFVVIAIFLVTVINVFVAAFTTADS